MNHTDHYSAAAHTGCDTSIMLLFGPLVNNEEAKETEDVCRPKQNCVLASITDERE